MISNEIFTEGRKWLFWLFLKLNLLFISIFFIIEGLIIQDLIISGFGFILIITSGLLVFRDIKQDPYHFIRLFYVQSLLWWRLRGPIIKNQPYYLHFLGGSILQTGDIVRTVSVKKEQLMKGKTLLVKTKVAELCPDCRGKRSAPLSVQIECKSCQNGVSYFLINNVNIPIPCNICLGTGWIPVNPCPTCKGCGSIWKRRRIKVQIPPYSKAGSKLRIPAMGKVDPKTLHQSDLFLKLREPFLNII